MPNYVYRIQRNVAVSASTGREIVAGRRWWHPLVFWFEL